MKGEGRYREAPTPFFGPEALPNASITLFLSCSTSLTQSVFPVATSRCVSHALTKPYKSSDSSILKFLGYRTVHDWQSCEHSSPSTAGSVRGKISASGAGPSADRLPDTVMANVLVEFMRERKLHVLPGGGGEVIFSSFLFPPSSPAVVL